MIVIIEQDLCYKQENLTPEDMAGLSEVQKCFEKNVVFHKLTKSADSFELRVFGQKLTLSEEHMSEVFQCFNVFWDLSLHFTDVDSGDFRFYCQVRH